MSSGVIANALLSAALTIVLVELFLRLPFPVALAGAGRTSSKALRTLRARHVSDHWKEKAMLAYSGQMFASSFRLIALLAIIGVAAVLLSLAIDLVSPGFSAFIVGLWGLLATIVWAFAYVAVRRVFVRPRPQASRSSASARSGVATERGA